MSRGVFLSFLELPVFTVFTSFAAGFYPVFTGFYSFYVFRSQFHVRFGTTVFFVVAFSFPSRASVANENTENWCGHALTWACICARFVFSAGQSKNYVRTYVRSREVLELCHACSQASVWTDVRTYVRRPTYLRTYVLDPCLATGAWAVIGRGVKDLSVASH